MDTAILFPWPCTTVRSGKKNLNYPERTVVLRSASDRAGGAHHRAGKLVPVFPLRSTKCRGRPSNRGTASRMSSANGFANEGWARRLHGRRSPSAWFVISGEISDPPMISSAKVLATWRSAFRSVCTYCFMVNATSAWPGTLAQRPPVDLGIACGGITVPHVVQVDLRQPGRSGEAAT